MLRARHIAPAAVVAALLLSPERARANVVWGDAALTADDVRISLDSSGRAHVEHQLTIGVSGKRFRAFTVDGVDDGLVAPADAALRDGPGWSVPATDAQGSPIEAFAEPAKEPRRLRVRLGHDGVPRGEYVLKLGYDVDLAARHAFARDGNRLRFEWSAPSWPEGFDRGRIVLSLPPGRGEPTVSLFDSLGGPSRSVEGVALITLVRGAADEIRLERPHVPAHDDARWVVTLDRHALAGVDASLGPREDQLALDTPTKGPSRTHLAGGIAAGFASLLASILVLRDRASDRVAAGWGRGKFRPLLPLGTPFRAVILALSALGIVGAAFARQHVLTGVALAVGLAAGTLRSPRVASVVRRAGSWLAVPADALPTEQPVAEGPIDPGSRWGKLFTFLLVCALAAGCVWLWRGSIDRALLLGIEGLLFAPLLLTGRACQLPSDPASSAHRVLAPIARVLERTQGLNVRWIARRPSDSTQLDGVRLRLLPQDRARAKAVGMISIEVAVGRIVGLGAETWAPEVLVRVEAGSVSASALDAALLALAPDESLRVSFARSLGRTAREIVFALRTTNLDVSSIEAAVRWTLAVTDLLPAAGQTELLATA